jgi:hypothetical protein
MCHIKAITQQGHQIVGFRDLSEDGIEPFTFTYGSRIYRGFQYLREYDRSKDRDLPALGAAGPSYLDARAAYLFEKKKA